MLIKGLPAGCPLDVALQAAEAEAQKPTVEKLRERQAYYEARAKEAANV